MTFNPTNATPPVFQVFDPSFVTDILGPSAVINEIAANDTFAFAHEAPIYDPVLDAVFFASNDGGALGMSGLDKNNQIGTISLKDAEKALQKVKGGGAVNVPVQEVGTSSQNSPFANNTMSFSLTFRTPSK